MLLIISYILINLIISKIKLLKDIKRYLSCIVKINYIVLLISVSIISNLYIIYINSKYEKFSYQFLNAKAIVISNAIQEEYAYKYTIKVIEGISKNKKFILYVKKSQDKSKLLNYGDLIYISGEVQEPTKQRNYKGFKYKQYLKSKKIYGILKINNGAIQILENSKVNKVFMYANKIRLFIDEKAKEILPTKTSGLLIGLLIGDYSSIPDEVVNLFRTSSLLHILAVSGTHVVYIISIITYLMNKGKVPRKIGNIIAIFTLIFFLFITGFAPSITRACIMGCILLIAKIIFRKPDVTNSILLSLLVILIYNPFAILDIGLQLSYMGTLGIILFNKNIIRLLLKLKLNKKVAQILAVIFSAQITLFPIIMVHFNTISLTFFISNVLVMPILGFATIFGFITVIIPFLAISKFLALILNLNLELLILIAKSVSILPLSNLIVKTPYTISIIIYYFILFTLNYIFSLFYKDILNLKRFQRKIIRNIKSINKEKAVKEIVIIALIITSLFYSFKVIPKTLKIYFIDVGQRR